MFQAMKMTQSLNEALLRIFNIVSSYIYNPIVNRKDNSEYLNKKKIGKG